MTRRITRKLAISGAVLGALLTLGGCSVAGDGVPADPGAVDPGPGAPGPGAPGPVDGGVGAPELPSSEDAPRSADWPDGSDEAAGADRQIVVTGSVLITTADPVAASREAVRIVETAGGRVDGRSEWAATDFSPGGARLELRIPSERLTAVLDELGALGRTDSVQTTAADVTATSRDLDARIAALEDSIVRIRALMAEASDVSDLILIESELSSRQAQLESLLAEQRWLADQVSMSAISLELRSEAVAGAPVPGSFWDGLVTGWSAFVAFLSGVLVVLGVVLPWLVFFGLIALGVVLLVRRRRRRRASAVEAAAEGVQPVETA